MYILDKEQYQGINLDTIKWATGQMTFKSKGAQFVLEFDLHTPSKKAKETSFKASSYGLIHEDLIPQAMDFIWLNSKKGCIPMHIQHLYKKAEERTK